MIVVIFNVVSILLCYILVLKYIYYILRKYFPAAMDMEEAKFMRTDRRPGTIDVHPTMNALVLNYELEVQILGDNDRVLYGEKAPMKKIIELPMLNTRVDCNTLGKDVLAHCDLIHPSRILELEQIIFYLKKRKLHQNIKDVEVIKKSGEGEKANINSLNDYIELLYEDVPDKVKGSNLIMQLAKDSDNLEALSKNETVLSALARVLREDWKKSIVLSTNLVFTFFCFSTYSNFHHVILKYKIGSLCMDIIDYELCRHETMQSELSSTGQRNGPRMGSRSAAPLNSILSSTCPNSASMSELHRSRIPEPVRPRSGNYSDYSLSNTGANGSIGDISVTAAMSASAVMEGSVYGDELNLSTESIGSDEPSLSDAERSKRFRTLIRKQDGLLRVAFYLLLNIAEDESVEEKMARRDIVNILVRALARDNDELLVLCTTFLKKLSIIQTNKDSMAQMDILDRLYLLLNSNVVDLVHLTLKLLFNLSFDTDLRLKMVDMGYLPKLITLLGDHKHQEIVLKLLYHLSYDQDTRVQFTDNVSLISDMLLLSAETTMDPVLVALCINLSVDANNSQQMADNGRLHALMTRAFQSQDVLLMKVVHNIAEHNATRATFVEFVGDLAKAVTESKQEDFIVECLGILSNLHLPELDWAEIFRHFDLTSWVKNILKSNNSEPDLVLQIIVLLGTAVHDTGCATLLCKADVFPCLIELLKTHQEDDEIVLQIVYVFMITLSHGNTVKHILNKTEAAAYLIDLVQDGNRAIRQVCNECLDMIADAADEADGWVERIRIERFRTHNAQWLQMVDAHQFDHGATTVGGLPKNGPNTGGAENDEDDDNELPPYLNTQYLSTAVVPPLSDLNGIGDDIISEKEFQNEYFSKSNNDILEDFEMASM